MIKLPIVIIESDDISIHPTVDHAEKSLEVQDVVTGIYTTYDSDGYLLGLDIEYLERKSKFLWFTLVSHPQGVVIRENNTATNRSEELRTKLINYLHQRNKKLSKEELTNLSLVELIQIVSKYMPWRV